MDPLREQQIMAAWDVGKQRRHRWLDGPMLVTPPEGAIVAFQLSVFPVDGGIHLIVAAEGVRVANELLTLERADELEQKWLR